MKSLVRQGFWIDFEEKTGKIERVGSVKNARITRVLRLHLRLKMGDFME